MEWVAFKARLLTLSRLEQCFDVLLHNAFDILRQFGARTDKASMLTESVTSDKAILASYFG